MRIWKPDTRRTYGMNQKEGIESVIATNRGDKGKIS